MERDAKGRMVFTLEELEAADADSAGFCLLCGEEHSGVEPDTQKYECECCGERAVYGAAELALMGRVK